MNRLALLGASVLMLAACNDDPAPEAADDAARTAEGEVLGGSISDAMLPLDTVTSQAPPLRQETEARAASEDSQGDGAATEEGETSAARPEPESEAEPAPETQPEP